jgi:hypothetical protein
MITIARTPIRVYSSVEKRPRRHWRQRAMNPEVVRTHPDIVRIKELESDVKKYKNANEKLKKLAEWNLRSTRSALKDVQEILETLQDLYGDEATPKSD